MSQQKAICKERIILGIDPGTSITGYGVIKTSGNIPELIAIGSIDLSKHEDHYLKIKHIFERTLGIIDEYKPDELAIEAPFYGKNVQSMLKLGRAQGAAIAAALSPDRLMLRTGFLRGLSSGKSMRMTSGKLIRLGRMLFRS